MVQIKFTTFGATSAGGSFAPGDLMRCHEDMAKHLVDEAKCAVYVQPKKADLEPAEPKVFKRKK